jgi:hypothetical protein
MTNSYVRRRRASAGDTASRQRQMALRKPLAALMAGALIVAVYFAIAAAVAGAAKSPAKPALTVGLTVASATVNPALGGGEQRFNMLGYESLIHLNPNGSFAPGLDIVALRSWTRGTEHKLRTETQDRRPLLRRHPGDGARSRHLAEVLFHGRRS